MSRTTLGKVAAALLAATGVLVAPPAPVSAAAAVACSSADGVTAVVDFDGLGGGVSAGCAPDGAGKAASEVFRDAGYTLQYSQQPGMQGFVCKVQGKPADGDCAQNDQFWSLWWSDGTDGQWHFSSQGAGSLDVPDGGYVAFAWHQGGGDAGPPAVAPTPHQQEPEPDDGGNGSPAGNGGGDRGPAGGGDASATPDQPSSSAIPSASGTPTETERDRDRGRDRDRDRPDRDRDRRRVGEQPTDASSSATPGIEEITQGPDDVDPVSSEAGDGEGLPAWVPIVLIVLVLGAAALVPILRRRAG